MLHNMAQNKHIISYSVNNNKVFELKYWKLNLKLAFFYIAH